MIFSLMLPFWVATGMQDTYLTLGLVIATALAAFHILIGCILLFMTGRRMYPYILECCMLIIFPVLLAITLASSEGKNTIQRDFNFITCSALAGVSILSMILTYPIGIQHVQELVPWMYHGHEDVLNAGYICSGVLFSSFAISCLLYLIPVCQGVEGNHNNPLNLIFRLTVPEVLTFLACLFVRFFPSRMVRHLQSTGLNDWQFQGKANQMMMAYPSAAKVINHPRVIDNAILAPYPKNAVVPGPVGLAEAPPRPQALYAAPPQVTNNPSYAYGLQNEIKGAQAYSQPAYGLQNEIKGAQAYSQPAYGLQNEVKSYSQSTYYPDGMITPHARV
jgi:hypothetical protein